MLPQSCTTARSRATPAALTLPTVKREYLVQRRSTCTETLRSLWLSGYPTDNAFYKAIVALNAARKSAMNAGTNFLTTELSFKSQSDIGAMVVSKPPLLGLFTNTGSSVHSGGAKGGNGGWSITGSATGGDGGDAAGGFFGGGNGGQGGNAKSGNSGNANGGSVTNTGNGVVSGFSQGGNGGVSKSGNAQGGKGGDA